jgi:hypothetical protein
MITGIQGLYWGLKNCLRQNGGHSLQKELK